MLTIRLSDRPMATAEGRAPAPVLVLPVVPNIIGRLTDDEPEPGAALAPTSVPLDDDLRAEIEAHLIDIRHTGRAGRVATLPRPLRTPRKIVLVGVGADDEAGWRAAGAALIKSAGTEDALFVAVSTSDRADQADRVRGAGEGLWLASYTFRLTEPRSPTTGPRGGVVVDTSPDDTLRRVTLAVDDSEALEGPLAEAFTVATATRLARDLTNMPSEEKTPAWFAGQIEAIAAGNDRLAVRVRSGAELAEGGFGGIIAVGGGSTRGPRLVELTWEPEDPACHVVLIGKGITFDTGGICIKPNSAMTLMRKDMGGAAAIMAATLAAAEMNLPVRITALAPLAENMASGSAFRPGDIVRHYGGATSEILNTDAEGRVVLADVLAYAADALDPDFVIDLATLTGANAVALGKRMGALFTENDELATALGQAATAAGEKVWRMPLHDDYVRDIRSELADVANSSDTGGGAITAALYLREFTGVTRDRWVHIDMSAPSWADSPDGELTKGATGWGVRTLVRWMGTLAD